MMTEEGGSSRQRSAAVKEEVVHAEAVEDGPSTLVRRCDDLRPFLVAIDVQILHCSTNGAGFLCTV